MMDHYCLLLIKIINTATIYHAYSLTITTTITRQCGGTPVSFASVLFFNLERKLKYTSVLVFSDLLIFWWYDDFVAQLMAPSNQLMMPTDMMYLFCMVYHLLTLSAIIRSFYCCKSLKNIMQINTLYFLILPLLCWKSWMIKAYDIMSTMAWQ